METVELNSDKNIVKPKLSLELRVKLVLKKILVDITKVRKKLVQVKLHPLSYDINIFLYSFYNAI